MKMPNLRIARPLACLALVGLPILAECNDTLVRAVGGGIVPVKSSNIRMLSERLEISPRRVKVDYLFVNESNADASELLAFPMPEYPALFGLSGSDTVRPLDDFVTLVEGEPVASRRERLAKLGSEDITTKLRTLGLREEEIFGGSGACRFEQARPGTHSLKCDYTEAQKRKLEQLCEGCSGAPPWQISETLIWKQTFPSQRPLRVVHQYAAKAGAHYLSGIDPMDVRRALTSDRELVNEACIDEGFLSAAARIAARGLEPNDGRQSYSRSDIYIRSVEYVLGTGRNWKGPIAEFELVIVKDKPDQLVSLCFPGTAVRSGPRQISIRHKNFVPQDRLVVYFVDLNWDFSRPEFIPK